MMKIIAITGADGTGKSTLCRNLCAKFPNFKEVSIWDAMDGSLFHTKKDIDTYLCTLSPNARLLFLSHAFTQALYLAKKSAADVLLLNGYYYKYFASEWALGADLGVINKLITTFPIPSLIIELVVDSDVSYTRKDKLSRYECGLKTPSLENFEVFQKKVIAAFQIFDRSGWQTISTQNSAENVFQESLKIMEK